MAQLVADCPRCGAQSVTFDLLASNERPRRYDWQGRYEAFSVCRHCHKATTFILITKGVHGDAVINAAKGLPQLRGAVNDYLSIDGYISLKDESPVEPPEHLPSDIESVFREGVTCLAVGCNNAAATMFRLCVDLATTSRLPESDVDGLNAAIRRSLGLRLEYLFRTNRLPAGLQELSKCIREDGNDGAHAGTLTKEDAEDLLDFTTALLESLYTVPMRLKLAQVRRDKRREPS